MWTIFAILHDLWGQLHELQGKLLVCDCVWQDLCEADMLAGLAFEASDPEVRPLSSQAIGRQSAGSSLRKVVYATALHRSQAFHMPRPIPLRSQESVVLCFQKLFPAAWFLGFSFPMIEDLVNQEPFSAYPEWLSAREYSWDGPLGPQHAPKSVRLAQRMTEAQQSRGLSHRASLPPLLPFGLDVDSHFQLSRVRATQPLPTEGLSVLDPDLHFAAWQCGRLRGSLRRYRQRAVGVLSELASRWSRVTAHLRSFQQPPIAAVTASRDVGLVALLMVLLQWPDATYPYGLITGLPAVGFAPCYGIFPELDVPRTTFEEVLGSWQEDNAQILRTLKAGRDDEFLLAQSLADASQGFCSAPMTRSQLLEVLKGASHRLIPRCVITQSSGKQRIIDDAAKGGQSASSSDSNKLVLCTPMRPAQHIQSLLSSMSGDSLRRCREDDSLESGSEDWPNAYRHSPMGTREARGCVVVFWHHEWQAPAFQLYAGLLFGLPLAVTSFNRYSKFVEACGRRLLSVLVSMYFDDATITDWASSKGSGQHAFGHLNKLLGTPFAEEKRQAMGPTGVFLGLEHDFTDTLSTGSVAFWAKEKLVQKLQGIIMDSKRYQTLPPGVAAKLYGLANFFEQGVFGRIGCGGLHAIKEREVLVIDPCFAILFRYPGCYLFLATSKALSCPPTPTPSLLRCF